MTCCPYQVDFAGSNLLPRQDLSMDIRNHGLGVRNLRLGICNHRLGIRDCHVGIDHQLGLGGFIIQEFPVEPTERTLKT